MGSGGRFSSCDLEGLRSALVEFAEARDWQQFHTPRNLLLALVGEVGELSELFQWRGECRPGLPEFTPEDRENVGQKLSDCLLYLIRMTDVCGIDLSRAAMSKLQMNANRCPPDHYRGSSLKHTTYMTQSAVTQPATDGQQVSDATQSDVQRADTSTDQPTSPNTARSNPDIGISPAGNSPTALALGGNRGTERPTASAPQHSNQDMSLGTAMPPAARRQRGDPADTGSGNLVRPTQDILAASPAEDGTPSKRFERGMRLSSAGVPSSPRDGAKTTPPDGNPAANDSGGQASPGGIGALPPGIQLGGRVGSDAYRPTWAAAAERAVGMSPARSMPAGRMLSDVRSPGGSFMSMNAGYPGPEANEESDNQKRKRFTEEQRRLLHAVAEASGWSLLRVSQEDRDWLQETHGITKDKLQNFLNNHKPRDYKGRRGAPLDSFPSLSKVAMSEGLLRHLPPSLAAAQLQALARGGISTPAGASGPGPSSGSKVNVPHSMSGPLAQTFRDVTSPTLPLSSPLGGGTNYGGGYVRTSSEPGTGMFGSPPTNWAQQQLLQVQQQQEAQQQQQHHQQQQQLQLMQMGNSGSIEGMNMVPDNGVRDQSYMHNVMWLSGGNGGGAGGGGSGGQGVQQVTSGAPDSGDGGGSASAYQMQNMAYGSGQMSALMNSPGGNMQQGGNQGKPMYCVVLPGQPTQASGPMSMG